MALRGLKGPRLTEEDGAGPQSRRRRPRGEMNLDVPPIQGATGEKAMKSVRGHLSSKWPDKLTLSFIGFITDLLTIRDVTPMLSGIPGIPKTLLFLQPQEARIWTALVPQQSELIDIEISQAHA